jgi:hypothetical protein
MKTTRRDLRHELLSDLHRLLSIASADDFLAASRLTKSENIKLALEALAEEHLADTPSRKRSGLRPRRAQSQARPRPSARAEGSSQLASIHDVLTNSPYFASKPELLRFAATEGFQVRVDPKESRSRIISKIMKQVEGLDADRRLQLFLRATRAHDEQTEGWLKVIRGR